jgi:RNA polymerase sigma-32 factor
MTKKQKKSGKKATKKVNKKGAIQSRAALPPASQAPLDRYLAEIRAYPVLSREEERALAIAYTEKGDLEAARKLITGNLRFVVSIANEYSKYGLKLLDLIQEGNIGLMKAVKSYNPYKNVRLITYAVWWIRSYIHDYIQRSWSVVKIGTTQAQRKLFYKLRKEQQKLEAMGIRPTTKLLAENLGVRESDVEEMDQRMRGQDLSLDAPMDESASSTFVDTVRDDTLGADVVLNQQQQISEIEKHMQAFSKTIKEKDLYIFENRLLSESPMTLQQIADHYGISKERARQIEVRVKKLLKEYFQEHLPDFELGDLES